MQHFPISFDGGVNLSEDPGLVAANEAMLSMNVRAYPPHWGIEKRFGRVVQYTLAGGTDRATHVWRVHSTTGVGSTWFLATTATNLQNLSEGTTIMTNAVGPAPSGGAFDPVTAFLKDTLWVQGVGTPQKWGVLTFAPGPATTVAWANTPPIGSLIVHWRGRIIISGSLAFPGRVWFSDVGNPESPAATYGNNFIDIAPPGDPKVTNMIVLGENLLIFTATTVIQIYDPNTFSNRTISRESGTPSGDASAVVNGRCYFGGGALYVTNGRTVEKVDTAKVERYLRSRAGAGSTFMEDTGDGRLIVAYSGATRPLFLEYVPATGAWYPHSYAISSILGAGVVGGSTTPQNLSAGLLAGDLGSNTVSDLFEGISDAGVAINAVWQTGWQGVQEIEPLERIRRLNVLYKGKMRMDLYKDLDPFTSVANLVLPETTIDLATIPGQAYNTGGVIDPAYTPYSFARWRPELRSRYRSVKFSDATLNKFFSLRDAEYVLRGGKEH